MSKRYDRIVHNLLFTGLGIVAGYGIFFLMWKAQCFHLIRLKETKCNETRVALQSEYSSQLAKGCPQDKDYTQLALLLEQQSSLTDKYQDLFHKHEETLAKLSATRQPDDQGVSQLIHSLSNQINRLQQDLGDSSKQIDKAKQQAGRQLEALKSQLELSKSMLMEKVEEVQALKNDKSCARSDEGRDELQRLVAATRRRNMAESQITFGKGPYRVEFTLDFRGDTASTFQVEFDDLKEMPHTIWTFLNLVDDGLYLGTTLGYADNEIIGGDPPSANKQGQSSLTRHYAEMGYGMEPLLFEESSPQAPCSRYSFGLLGKGPRIFIPMMGESPVGKFIGRSCPGTIVQGYETLSRITATQKRVAIQSARVIVWGNDKGRKEEL